MCKLLDFPGCYGFVVGLLLLLLTWLLAYFTLPKGQFNFDFPNEGGSLQGSFLPLLSSYIDIAKYTLGLASGSIVLLVGAAAFHSDGRVHLPSSFANPLFLLVLSILWGVFFMALMMVDYEAYRHGTRPYTRFKYSRTLALGFGCLLCFCIGYAWLAFVVTR